MPRYSIAAAHLNMVDTVEPALQAMLDQLGDRFEVVVVDGGSTDGSLNVLRRLEDTYDALRVIELDPNPNRYLGTDRNTAVEHANGEFVMGAMDLDDHYREGSIPAFVEVYEQLSSAVDEPFVLHGTGMYVAPRELRLSYSLPNIPRCEDRYLWRHLFADDRLVWIRHGPLGDGSLGYERGKVAEIRNDIEEKACDFQQGITLRSCIQYIFSPSHHVLERNRGLLGSAAKRCYDLCTYPYSYLKARNRPHYTVPKEFRHRGALEHAILEHRQWLSELEAKFNTTIDRAALGDVGREIFYPESQ